MSGLLSLGYALSLGFGKAFSEIFSNGTVLKRAYEFWPTQKWNFQS
ncbi:IS4/Tn5 family transposase DNA-binding protein [Nostoc sp.]